ncbi:5fff0995-5d71-46e1-bad0-9c4b03acc019-CDS [Sclerotinia trifoliorum]|uniref:5fff0995-5d71-46e1-bad0-9c4b03acc019-CDS n=1 Tax=Sclerotinia trifoliorum TaxID=28548 RepID=A0A8H2VXX5_9HELO|nr:5fff0995-5d71-46e1-bad0-9c4b03acc019-CDS [Sclerotinia trifoliorum]
MKDIYSKCWKDLLWLGQRNVVMDLGLRMVEGLLSRHREAKEQSEPVDTQTLVQRLNEDIKEVAKEPMEPALVADNHHFRCLKAICEVVFSIVQAIQHQRLITGKIETGQDSHLLDVLARFQKTYSTDPKDKLFALLALTSNPLGLQPDYDATERTVFTKFATAYINHVGNVDILCQSRWKHYVVNKDITHGIPSWVPDLGRRWPVRLIFAQRRIFKAGGLKCSVTCNVTNEDRLIVEGVNLGEVNRRYPIPNRKLTTEWIPDELKVSKTLMYAPRILSKAESAFQAFWRTLLSDCVRYPMRRLNEDEYAS